jgi:hypothetical protein
MTLSYFIKNKFLLQTEHKKIFHNETNRLVMCFVMFIMTEELGSSGLNSRKFANATLKIDKLCVICFYTGVGNCSCLIHWFSAFKIRYHLFSWLAYISRNSFIGFNTIKYEKEFILQNSVLQWSENQTSEAPGLKHLNIQVFCKHHCISLNLWGRRIRCSSCHVRPALLAKLKNLQPTHVTNKT